MNAHVTVFVCLQHFRTHQVAKIRKKTMLAALRVAHSPVTTAHIKPSSSSAFIPGLTKTPAVVWGNYEVQLRLTVAPLR